MPTRNFQMSEDDDEAGNISVKLRDMIQKITMSAVLAGSKNAAHAMLITSSAASGTLHVLAKCVARDQESAIDSTAVMFAALLAYHVGPFEERPGVVQNEFSPLVIYSALKDMEKMTGQRPDEHLNETMCKVARESVNDPAFLAHVRQQRAETFGGSASLN